jgi:hypothetical protein
MLRRWLLLGVTPVPLLAAVVLAGATPEAPVGTLDELIQRHDSAPCQACHAEAHEQWRGSFHGRSIIQSLGSLRAFIDATEKERKLPADKTQMLKCLDCHAPMVNEASEGAIEEIVSLVKTAVDEKDEAKKKAARDKLGNLSVNCTGCHAVKGTANAMTPPEPGVLYGLRADGAPHPTKPSPVLGSSVFCSQCHALWQARDGEQLYCTTIFESHQNAYRGMGGTQTCQDCHMKSRGHAFPGAHNQTLVREGITLGVEAVAYRHIVGGKLQPRAIVTVDVGNQAGHRIPDG